MAKPDIQALNRKAQTDSIAAMRLENRTRCWPREFIASTYSEADGIERVLKEFGFETVRYAMAGQYLVIRARKA